MDLQELQTKYPSINWTEYLNEMLAPHAQVQTFEKVVVQEPSYFESFFKLISETPKRVLANYIMWYAALDSFSYSGQEIQKVSFQIKFLANHYTNPNFFFY